MSRLSQAESLKTLEVATYGTTWRAAAVLRISLEVEAVRVSRERMIGDVGKLQGRGCCRVDGKTPGSWARELLGCSCCKILVAASSASM